MGRTVKIAQSKEVRCARDQQLHQCQPLVSHLPVGTKHNGVSAQQ